MINSFEVSSLLHSWIPLSTKQENKVNNQTSDQIIENVHTQNDSQHSNTIEETLFTNLQIMDSLSCTSNDYEHNITNETICTLPRRKQLRTAKQRKRNFLKLSHFLVDVEKSERKKMLEKAMNNNDHLMSSFVGNTMNYFQKMIRDGRKGFAAKVQGAELLYKFFALKLDDMEYQRWFADESWLHDVEDLVEFLDCADLSETQNLIVGRKLLRPELRQQVYNFWEANSTVSVHSSNGRHKKNQ